MRRTHLPASLLLVVALFGNARADDFKSGPQDPRLNTKTFNPLNCSGPEAGKRHSLVISHGANPAVMIFARDTSDELVRLVRKVDEAAVKNARAGLGCFVVVCSEDAKMEERLKELAKTLGLKKCILTLYPSRAGPNGYNLHAQADVTVVLYVRRNARAVYAFKKGEMTGRDADAVLADLTKILPAKK